MIRKLTIAAAALALAIPGVAVAKGNPHTHGSDGPAVGAIPAICNSQPGQAWARQQMQVANIYWQAYLSTGYVGYATLAQKHLVLVEWHNLVCSESPQFGF